MNHALDVGSARMVDGPMLAPVVAHERVALNRLGIDRRIVRYDHFNLRGDVLFDVPFDGAGLHILSPEKTKIAAALPDANDNRFLGIHGATGALTLLFAAHIGFVHFDDPGQWRPDSGRHCRSDAMTQVPGRFVARSKRPLQLFGAHALLGLAEQQDGKKPLLKAQVSVSENRAGCHRKLIAASRAVVQSVTEGSNLARAAQTDRAFGPAQALKQFPAGSISRKKPNEIRKCHGKSPRSIEESVLQSIGCESQSQAEGIGGLRTAPGYQPDAPLTVGAA